MDNPYQHFRTLDGYNSTINSLAFSPTGDYLATGGDDGVICIWNPHDGGLQGSIQTKSPILCLIWDPKTRKRLFFGCQNGTAAFVDDFGQVPAYPIQTGVRGGQVYALAVDDCAGYVGISIGPEVHIAHRLLANGAYATISILPEPNSLPDAAPNADDRVRGRSLEFIKRSSRIIVSYLNHGVVCWDLKTSERLWRIIPSSENCHIGSSVLLSNPRSILVSNLSSGMNLYCLDTRAELMSYKSKRDASMNFPLSVASLKGGKYVACGTHTGSIDILNRDSGAIFQSLEHDSPLITCIVAHTSNGYEHIATATTGNQPVVKIWQASIERTALEAIKESFNRWRILVNDNPNEKGSSRQNVFIGVVVAIGTYLLTMYLFQPLHVDPSMETRATQWIPLLTQSLRAAVDMMLGWWEDIRQWLRQVVLTWLEVQAHEVPEATTSFLEGYATSSTTTSIGTF